MVRGKNIWHYLWKTDSHWQWCKGRGLEVLPLLCNTSTFTSHIFLLMNHPSKPRKLIKKSKNLFNLLRSPLHYSAGSKCCTRDWAMTIGAVFSLDSNWLLCCCIAYIRLQESYSILGLHYTALHNDSTLHCMYTSAERSVLCQRDSLEVNLWSYHF